MIGRIHSLETFSTADGPGIRFVTFFQGCNFRCKFCHNPDTWDCASGTEWEASEVIEKVLEYITFYRSSNGGLTASGGEPLLQAGFLLELFELAHKHKVHTCLDTAGDVAGVTDEDLGKVLSQTDLVFLDIKETDELRHRELTRRSMNDVLRFLHVVQEKKIPVKLRYVYIKGVNDSAETLDGLRGLKDRFSCVRGIDVLPYHRLGENKWKQLGIEYPLVGVVTPTSDDTENIRRLLC